MKKPNKLLISRGEIIHDALRQFARVSDKSWIWLNLEGGCAVGSYFLMKEAHRLGIEAAFKVGASHCWLESEGYIYDITASQFTCGNNDAEMDRAEKVRVVNLADVPYLSPIELMPREDLSTLPRHMWGMNRYQTRTSFYETSEDNIAHVRRTYPQGQNMRGYHMEYTSDDKVRIFWRGKNKTIG